MRSGLALFALVLALPGVSEACAVCFSGREETRLAFIGTTVLLTLMPMLLVGGAVYFLRRRYRELEAALPPEVTSSG